MHKAFDSFYINLEKYLKLSQKTYFLAHFERFFIYTLLRPMSYVLSSDKLSVLWSYIIVASFISAALLFVKL